MKLTKKVLQSWFHTAVDGGCSDAYNVLLRQAGILLTTYGYDATIKLEDLVSILRKESDKWQKEIDIATN